MKKGQIVVSYVKYSEEEEFNWIITKIEKKLNNGNYIVKDEYFENPKFERYTVSPDKIIIFPLENAKYSIDEKVLARWQNDEAIVIKIKGNILSLRYNGSKEIKDVSTSYITKYPLDFMKKDYNEEENEEEEEEIEKNKTIIKEDNEKIEKKNINFINSPPLSPLIEENHLINNEIDRNIKFFFNKPDQIEHSKMKLLTDNDFNHFMGNIPIFERIKSSSGTPLIDILQDPELFEQNLFCFTGNGTLYRKEIKSKNFKSGLENGINCGKMGLIFNKWNL